MLFYSPLLTSADLCQALTEREVELKKQMKEQEVKLKATAPDEKQLSALRKTVAANKKGTRPGCCHPSVSPCSPCVYNFLV